MSKYVVLILAIVLTVMCLYRSTQIYEEKESYSLSLFRAPGIAYTELRPGYMGEDARMGLFPPLVPLCSFNDI